MSVDDGLDPSEPLDLDRVRRLLYLRAVDRWDIPQQEIDKSGGPRDGETEFYIISSSHTAARIRIHHSRVIRFEGLEVDRYTKGTIGNWSDSVLQPAYDAVRDIDSGGQSLSSQLASAVQSVYKIKGLHEQILAGNREFVEDWISSLELFRSHLRAVGLDADNEDLQYLARPLGDSVTVYHALMHRVAAAADMPVTELFGMSPSGLSTDDQSGTRRFYDKITAEERQGEQGRALDRVLEVITNQSLVPSLDGAEVLYSWPSLYSPTAKEEAELTKLRAETAVTLIDAGVLQPAEVRAMGAEMLAIDIQTQSDEEVVEEPTDAILDPTERLQQARLAIQSGLLHLPDTASTFRPMLGLEPLKPGETETWFNLVKTRPARGSPA
jgi:phage-related protein (TIGR01555 family)